MADFLIKLLVLSTSCLVGKPPAEQDQAYDIDCAEGVHPPLPYHALGFVQHGLFFFGDGHLVAAHEKAVGVDAVGGAGDQGDQVFTKLRAEGFHLVWGHHFDLVYLIFQFVAGCLDEEEVVFFYILEVVKQCGVWQAGVSGEDGVRSLAADGEIGAEEVTNTALEVVFLGAVINRQVRFRARNDQSAHRIGGVQDC